MFLNIKLMVFLGLVVSNFLCTNPEKAIERSFFMGMAIISVWTIEFLAKEQ